MLLCYFFSLNYLYSRPPVLYKWSSWKVSWVGSVYPPSFLIKISELSSLDIFCFFALSSSTFFLITLPSTSISSQTLAFGIRKNIKGMGIKGQRKLPTMISHGKLLKSHGIVDLIGHTYYMIIAEIATDIVCPKLLMPASKA